MSNLGFSLDNLNINSFRVVIDKLPMFTYKLKTIDTPSLSLSPVPVPNPMQKMMAPGDAVEFGNLSMSFIVDENLYNYISIFNWMNGLGFPKSFDEFKLLISKETATEKRSYIRKETSDISLYLLTNHNNPNIMFRFTNAFPTSLSGISMTNSNTEAEVIEANCDISFTGMYIGVEGQTDSI